MSCAAIIVKYLYSFTNFRWMSLTDPSTPLASTGSVRCRVQRRTTYTPLDKFSTSQTALSAFTSMRLTTCPKAFTISISEIVSDDVMLRMSVTGIP